MKTYEITLLTLTGIKTETYSATEPLEQFEARMVIKHVQFTTIQSKEINP